MRAFDYGRHLGVAFQLIDDLLDFVSSAETLGKPVANDLKLGSFILYFHSVARLEM